MSDSSSEPDPRSRSPGDVLMLVPRLRDEVEWDVTVARLSRSTRVVWTLEMVVSDRREGGDERRSASPWEARKSEERGLEGLTLAGAIPGSLAVTKESTDMDFLRPVEVVMIGAAAEYKYTGEPLPEDEVGWFGDKDV